MRKYRTEMKLQFINLNKQRFFRFIHRKIGLKQRIAFVTKGLQYGIQLRPLRRCATSLETGAIFGLLMLVLPLTGILISRQPIFDYFEFPPLTRYVKHADFCLPVFIILTIIILVTILPFIIKVLFSQKSVPRISKSKSGSFPWWGWLGLFLCGATWYLTWHSFEWFVSFQVFTFTPLWLGYILIINALTYRRTGHCMIIDRSGYMLKLFLISAAFWWVFEYLNRFVQNWYYVGIGDLTSFQYFLFATLPFSTVLPAVLGTRELLSDIPRLSAGLDSFVKIRICHKRLILWICLIFAGISLTGIGVYPSYLFPVLWVSPLFVIIPLQVLHGRKTIFHRLQHGAWKDLYLLAVSALICGFFWEMWNHHSAVKWMYEIPFVNRFKIFEMPLLGYAGYLPFGLECAVVADLFIKEKCQPRIFYEENRRELRI